MNAVVTPPPVAMLASASVYQFTPPLSTFTSHSERPQLLSCHHPTGPPVRVSRRVFCAPPPRLGADAVYVSAIDLGRVPGCSRVAKSETRGCRGIAPCPDASRERTTPQTHYTFPWHRRHDLGTVKQHRWLLVSGQIFQDKGNQGGCYDRLG